MSTHGVNFKFNVIGGNVGKMFASIDRLSTKARVGFGKTDKAISKNQSSVSKLVSGVDKFAKKTSKLPTRGWTKTDRSVNRVLVKIRKLDRRLTSLPKRLQGGLDKVTTRFGRMGQAVAGFVAVQQITAFMSKITSAASDLTEATNKSQVTFESYFSTIDKWSATAYKSTGLAKHEAHEAAASFGAFFKNLGFGEKQLGKMSQGAVQLAADIGSFHNLSTNEAFDKLMAGLSGEAEPLKRLGYELSEVTIKNKAFAMGLIRSTKGTLPQAIKTQAAYALILEQSKDAMGDFSRTSGDYATNKKILTAQISNLTTWLGTKFVPILNKGITKLRSMATWVDENKTTVWKWMKVVGSIAGVFSGLLVASKTILGIASFIGTVKKAFLILKGVMLANPFGWAIVAVGFIATLIASNDNLRNKIVDFFKQIPAYASSVFEWMKGWAAWFVNNHPFMWLINVIDNVFPGFKEKLGDWINEIKGQFLKMVDWFYDKFIQPIAGYWDKLKGLFGFGSKPIQKIKIEGDGGDGSDVKSLYNNVNGILGVGSQNSPKSQSGGSSVNDRIASVSAKGGGSIKHITINIENLVREMNNITHNVTESNAKMKEMIIKTLISATNDVNYG